MSVTFYAINAKENKELTTATMQIVPRVGEIVRVNGLRYKVVLVEHTIDLGHSIAVFCDLA